MLPTEPKQPPMFKVSLFTQLLIMTYISYALMILQSTACFGLSVTSSFLLTRSLNLTHSPFKLQNESSSTSALTNLSASTHATSPFSTSFRLSIPATFQYSHAPYSFIYTHNGASYTNPSVSLYNWRAAVDRATENIKAREVQAHTDPADPVSGSRFECETLLERRSPHHVGQPRQLKFIVMPTSDILSLTYEDTEITLLGLKEYTKIWDHRSRNDCVGMCTFKLSYEEYVDMPFTKGSASLIISPPQTVAASKE